MLNFAIVVLSIAASTANAQTLEASATYTLSGTLSSGASNFHPQGLGIDEGTGRLIYIQQSHSTVYSSALDGSDVQPLSTSVLGHGTSVAVWEGSMYFSNYSGNTSGQDMHKVVLPNGGRTNYGNYVAAYGGFPIDIRGGELYRTNLSGSYSWANLNQIVVTDVASPNGGARTFTLNGTSGVGDIAVDLDSNSIWVLEYTSSARIHRYDITSTALVETYTAVGDGVDAGLTYYNGNLYYYDWQSGSGSTLTVFPTGFATGCTDGMDPFDLDEDGSDETCIHPTATIDSTVTVEPGARVHANAIVAPRAIIGRSADIGAGSIISRNAEVRGTLVGTVIVGRSAQVLNGATVEDGSVIGYASVVDNSDCGPNTILGSVSTVRDSSVGVDGGAGNVVLARDTIVQAGSLVGSETIIGPVSELTASDHGAGVRIRKGTVFSAGSSVGDDARVGRNVTVGANAAIAADARIGANSAIGANACAGGRVAHGSVISTCS
jgi:carbonic anhydrase/acetyltransferase-like protein (isoleucine patch superfamily)